MMKINYRMIKECLGFIWEGLEEHLVMKKEETNKPTHLRHFSALTWLGRQSCPRLCWPEQLSTWP